jgi:hypothetical protein
VRLPVMLKPERVEPFVRKALGLLNHMAGRESGSLEIQFAGRRIVLSWRTEEVTGAEEPTHAP